VLAALFAPSLAVLLGWRNVLGLAIIPLAIVLALFVWLAKDSPRSPPRKSLKDYAEVLRASDAWWLMAFYCVSFGGFVGLSSFLPIYFNDQYALSPVAAGYCTAAAVFAGSFIRPFGGAVADRIGGVKALSFVYGLVAVLALILSRGIASLSLALPIIVVIMGALGAGNGAVFQIAPQRFPRNVGVVTGLVGATGGAGGFYLAASLGVAKQMTGGYGAGLAIFACLALVALAALSGVGARWRRTWLDRSALAAANA
jgi:MFS transporter, NNP family, nitrate/nitrite transporter